MLNNLPIKLLDSFNEDDKDFFFGRELEIENLFQLIKASDLLLIYGPTGVGKTSIIQCGLFNKFNKAEWLPLTIRRNENLLDSVKEKISTSLKNSKRANKLSIDVLVNLHNLYFSKYKPIYLIFDQFEELFISGTKEEALDFFKLVHEILQKESDVKVIISMREEYLAHLTDYENILPSLFMNRFRLEKMNLSIAKSVVQKTCNYAQIQIEEEANNLIIEKIKYKKEIELTLLQILLDRLVKELREKNSHEARITIDLLDKYKRTDDLLLVFLEEEEKVLINELNQNFGEKKEHSKLPMKVLGELVTSEKTKKQESKENIISKLVKENIEQKVLEFIIEQFISKRVIRVLLEDTQKLELMHDTLAIVVFDRLDEEEKQKKLIKKSFENDYGKYLKIGTLLTREEINYYGKYLNQEELDIDQKEFIQKSIRTEKIQRREKEEAKQKELDNAKKLNRMYKGILGLIGVIIGIVLLSGFGFLYYRHINDPETIMKRASDEKLWSEYQGRMNWDDAVKKCKSIGMRLPTRQEWQGIYKYNNKVIASWKEQGLYWTNDEYDESSAISFYSNGGGDDSKSANDGYVRCIR